MEKPPEDRQYLKDYIKEHPNNKMAWYLLGRQYAAKGETGKANYCFAQAGEVYRAFEEGTAFGPAEEPEREAAPDADTLRRKSRRAAIWKAAVVVLLLLFIGHIPFQPDEPKAGAYAADAQESGLVNEPDGSAAAAAPDKTPETADFDVVYAAAGQGGSSTDRANQLGQLLRRFQDKAISDAETLLLVEPQWNVARDWLLWPAPVKPLLAVKRSETASTDTLVYYDAKACSCKPAETAEPMARYERWQNEQLQQLVVRSAIAAYESSHAKAPESVEQLARNYPDNWLPGYTPAMKTYFERQIEERRTEQPSAAGQSPSQSADPNQSPNSGDGLLPSAEALREPLSILVDKTTHTLALVSGSVLIRSYPVGLGGDRTPEGEFTITEKVRNPNGRDNGTFGSRGMTLSDTLYAIHGTNQPSTIGKDKSLGCIRMLKPDVEELFDLAPKGTKVVIGSNLSIPTETIRSNVLWRLPSGTDETNPHKTYKWLD